MEISAEKVMDDSPLTVQNDQSLGSIKNRMEEEEVRAVPVVDSKGNLEGVIGYRDIIRFIQFNPERTKISKVMHQPPEFETEDSLVELCVLRINSGRKLLVNTANGKLKGIVGDAEFIEALKEADELENISTRSVHSENLQNVFEEDSVEKARHLMLDENISRLPVLDKNGKLSGIIRSTDILRMMVPQESQNSGGTAGDRHGTKEVNIAGGGEKERMSQVTADQLMQEDVVTSSSHMDCSEAAEKMSEEGNDEIIFMEDVYPKSIVTGKDLISQLAKFAPGSTVLVTLTGLEVPEEKAAVHKKIRTQLQGSLGRKLNRPEEVNLVVKKAEKDGKQHRWELDLKLYSEYGVTAIKEDGWDLLEAVDEALNELNTVIRKKKEKRSEH